MRFNSYFTENDGGVLKGIEETVCCSRVAGSPEEMFSGVNVMGGWGADGEGREGRLPRKLNLEQTIFW